MKAIDMTKVYSNYKGKWVALKGPKSAKVVASAKTLKEVLQKAQKRGVAMPVVTQIPKEILPIVGNCS